MTARLTVLASGSSGNTTFLEMAGFGLLIDCGLNPRMLGYRLASIGSSWDKVHAVLLTHIHTDHWKNQTLGHLSERGIPIYAHPAHLDHFDTAASFYPQIRKAGLVRTYAEDCPFPLAPGLACRSVRVSHDAEPTFAFRIDGRDLDGSAWAIGYASDLGCGSDQLIEAFSGVSVLALEYNHDERLERKSSRPKFLIDRVLSDSGHLSNRQAAELTQIIAARSKGLNHLIQLHLSRECNRPELAVAAGARALAEVFSNAELHTARQDIPTRTIHLSGENACLRPLTSRPARISVQFPLPGFEQA